MPYKSMCVLTRNHAPQEKLKAVFEAYNIPAMITIDHDSLQIQPFKSSFLL